MQNSAKPSMNFSQSWESNSSFLKFRVIDISKTGETGVLPRSYRTKSSGRSSGNEELSRLSKTYGGGPVYHEYPMNVKNS